MSKKNFCFNNDKVVVVENILSLTKRDPGNYGAVVALSHSIEILYKGGITESVSYGYEKESRDQDFYLFTILEN